MGGDFVSSPSSLNENMAKKELSAVAAYNTQKSNSLGSTSERPVYNYIYVDPVNAKAIESQIENASNFDKNKYVPVTQ